MHFAAPRRRHALIYLGAASIIALTSADAFSNPGHKPVASHQNKAVKAEAGKHQVAMSASHRNKAVKAEGPKQAAAASRRNKKAKADKRKHQERAPGPRILLPSDPTNAGNSTPRPPLTPQLATLKEAIRLVQQRKFDEATTLAASIDDPVARKVVEWAYLRNPESRAGFDRYNAFLQNNPTWSSTLLRRRAETRLWQERRDAATVRRFIGEQPVSTLGRLAIARTLLDKDPLGAARDARAIWQSAEYGEYITTSDATIASGSAESIADAMRAAQGKPYKATQSIGIYPTSGASDDYAFSRHLVMSGVEKIYGFTIEFNFGNPHDPHNFVVTADPDILQQTMMDVIPGLIVFAQFATKPVTLPHLPTIDQSSDITWVNVFTGDSWSIGADGSIIHHPPVPDPYVTDVGREIGRLLGAHETVSRTPGKAGELARSAILNSIAMLATGKNS